MQAPKAPLNQAPLNKVKRTRPKNLNLLTIRLPINALVSILHRATGCALFFSLPFLLLTLHWSLSSEAQYLQVASILSGWFFKLILIGSVWSFSHHFFAGIRHLAMDVHWMTTLMKARYTSKIVLFLGVLSTIVFTMMMWGQA